LERAAKADLEGTLQSIVQDVVEVLGYAGAMMAPYERGDVLPVRALYVDPELVSMEQIHRWEQAVAGFSPKPVSITNPDIARVCVYRDQDQGNLSVRAFKKGAPVISEELFDLFTPVAPPGSKEFVSGIQEELGINQVIAVPFFVETSTEEGSESELVGNLFAMKAGEITVQDQEILSAFGRQAAAAIENDRRRSLDEIVHEISLAVQANLDDESKMLELIAKRIVEDLDYVGAMVATAEPDDSLPCRALYVHPSIATIDMIHEWEAKVARVSPHPVSITNPDIARVYVHDKRYEHNLSVQAYTKKDVVLDNSLYSLCIPIAPETETAQSVIKVIQSELGINQVIAVPFFLRGELVGNLFTATRSRTFSSSEIEMLKALGFQAAVAIRNARLYRRSEERREAAQIFGKMAFTAAANVHDLRNHVGVVKGYLQMALLIDSLPDQRQEILDGLASTLPRLDQAADILDSLHEPWLDQPEEPTDVNRCLSHAIHKVFPMAVVDADTKVTECEAETGITLHISLADDLPEIWTSPSMLTEAFKVLIKNAKEAVTEPYQESAPRVARESAQGEDITVQDVVGQLDMDGESSAKEAPRKPDGHLWLTSHSGDGASAKVTIRDNGIGIKPENLNKVFEMRWTTKQGRGMGFGLYWTKDYVEGLGGHITVQSVWQQGTEFRISIPSAAKPGTADSSLTEGAS
jgi:signal transduction histidine kinase